MTIQNHPTPRLVTDVGDVRVVMMTGDSVTVRFGDGPARVERADDTSRRSRVSSDDVDGEERGPPSHAMGPNSGQASPCPSGLIHGGRTSRSM